MNGKEISLRDRVLDFLGVSFFDSEREAMMAKQRLMNSSDADFIKACEKGDEAWINFLMEQCDCYIPYAIHNENEGLFLACVNGHVQIVETLLIIEEVAKYAGIKSNRAIHYAAVNGHWNIVDILLAVPSVQENLSACIRELLSLAYLAENLDGLKGFLMGPHVNPKLSNKEIQKSIIEACDNKEYCYLAFILHMYCDLRVNLPAVQSAQKQSSVADVSLVRKASEVLDGGDVAAGCAKPPRLVGGSQAGDGVDFSMDGDWVKVN